MPGRGRISGGLARALSRMGYCSRAAARSLIERGEVSVNGRVVTDPGSPFKIGTDTVSVSRAAVASAERVYLMINKPRGLITTARDEQGRETIYSLLKDYGQWLAPVGRLDKASEGLLLLTNDSGWGARVAAPESHLDKVYHVQIAALASQDLLRKLKAGVRTTEGEFLAVKGARLVRHGRRNSWLEIVLDEGKNRHIRRMLAVLDIEVLRLVRIGIGPLALGDLAKGSVRQLSREEKSAVDRAITNAVAQKKSSMAANLHRRR